MALSTLHIIRSHYNYFNISRRRADKEKYKDKIVNYFYQNLNFFKNKDLPQCDILLISSSNTNNKKDNLFEKIIKHFKNKKISYAVLLRDFSTKQTLNAKQKKNYFLLNNKRNLFLDFFYTFILISNIIKITLQSLIFHPVDKTIFFNLLSLKNLRSSIYNINHTNSIFENIKKINPKKVIFTFEGYPWERMLNHKIKLYNKSILTYGYFFSVISKYHNTPFIRFGKNFDLDYILCAGEYSKKTFLDKRFDEKKIINIGNSNLDFNPKILKPKKKYCLILPENFHKEVIYLVNFAKKLNQRNNNIRFLLRLHPSTNLKYKEYIKKYVSGLNIKISNSNLRKDISISNMAIYRGSSTIIKTCSHKIIPIYIHKSDELSIDPLFKINNLKPNIKSIAEFENFYLNLKRKKYQYNKTKMRKIKKFCDNYFSKFNYKKLNKIF